MDLYRIRDILFRLLGTPLAKGESLRHLLGHLFNIYASISSAYSIQETSVYVIGVNTTV